MDSLYSRYASALLSLAKEEGKVKEYKEALIEIFNFLNENLDVKKYLDSYFVKENDKYEVVNKICESAKLKHLPSFIKLLIKKHRFNSFKEIVKEYVSLANNELGILEGYLYSVDKLTSEQIKKIEKAIGKNLGHSIELKPLIDTRLIGGIKVVVNDHVYDGSLLGKLNSLKSNLKERS